LEPIEKLKVQTLLPALWATQAAFLPLVESPPIAIRTGSTYLPIVSFAASPRKTAGRACDCYRGIYAREMVAALPPSPNLKIVVAAASLVLDLESCVQTRRSTNELFLTLMGLEIAAVAPNAWLEIAV
jgi:hypothetical protein